MPSSPSQCRYSTRRPPTSPPPGPQALERHLSMRNLILRAKHILIILLAWLQKPSSRGLWLPHYPLRAIQIVELGHFIISSTSTLRLCDNNQTFGIHWIAPDVPSRDLDDSQGVFLPQSGDGFLSVHDYSGHPESHNHSF